MTWPTSEPTAPDSTRRPDPHPTTNEPALKQLTMVVTQRVTTADLAGARIRIPVRSKQAFPTTGQHLNVTLRGVTVGIRWNPRNGTNPSRSGVLSIPKSILASLVRPDEYLTVVIGEAVIRID
jgi:hypothetical protein